MSPVLFWAVLLIVSRASFLEHSLAITSFSTLDTRTGSKRQTDFLSKSCHGFRADITDLIVNDSTLAGPLLRLAFHDATTRADRNDGGPNGSIVYEVQRPENRGISKPLSIVQRLSKSHNLSLADSIALAGATAVEAAGGPHIAIGMGRQDVNTADPEYFKRPMTKASPRSLVSKTLPSAGLDSDGLRLYFRNLGLSDAEWIALCGAHGLGRHVSLLGMSRHCLKNLTRVCLEEAPVMLPFVTESVDRFDNSYFQALLRWNQQEVELGDVAFIPTDVDLVVDAALRKYVVRYARDNELYSQRFSSGYQKLVDFSATTKSRY